MKRHRNRRLVCSLLAAALLLFGGSVHASEWLENVTVLVKIDGVPSGTAHVYDSEDYPSEDNSDFYEGRTGE